MHEYDPRSPLEWEEDMKAFTNKMAFVMSSNHIVKGDSFKNMSWAQLMDMLVKQIEDMQLDPDREPYFVNIANYAWMLWENHKQED